MDRLSFLRARLRPRGLALGLALGLVLAPLSGARATDLLQAWAAAQAHDPDLAAARQAQLAGQARADQATGLWRPTVEAHAGVGLGTQNSETRGARFAAPGSGAVDGADFDTSIRGGTQTRYGIEVRQPLIDLGRDAQAQQLRHSAAQAEAAWTVARQQAALRVTQRYFDVLLGERRLAVLTQQRQATEGLLGQARARFRSGDASIVDTHEAEARLGQIDTQVQLASTQLEIARAAFRDATGLDPMALAALREDAPALTARPERPLSAWLEQVDATSPELRQSLEAAAMAAQRAEGLRAVAQPTLNLVGAAGQSRLSGSGRFGDASTSASQWSVGLELRIPLYTGGVRDARYREALAERDGARFQAASARQQLERLTRAAWLSLESGAARIQALRQARQANAARRDATRLGAELGERTTLDRLDAEQALAQSELDLLQGLTELALDRLRLQALAGALDLRGLQALNCTLQGVRCP